MTALPKRVAILGSTGSIGTSAVEVIQQSNGRLQAVALSAHSSFDLLVQQAKALRPRWVVATNAEAAEAYDWSELPAETKLLTGPKSLEQVAMADEVDIVLAAIVGSAGLRSTWAALESKKTVALANKETLVMGGPLVTELAKRSGAKLLPVDSEHSAIFQALQSGDHPTEVERIVLTASGGPFREWSSEQIAQATIQDALTHPTWKMGKKITVDSATMMNKALEVIEARWLFDLPPEKIEVVVHPQSIVHGLVEFVDGSVIAQMSLPDMKMPIQYALDYPSRLPGVTNRLDFTKTMQLDFEPPDLDRFPALRLGYECAERGGTTGAVLNAANEAAVSAFLNEELKFTEIVPMCRRVLESHSFQPQPSLDELIEQDRWARQEVTRWVCA